MYKEIKLTSKRNQVFRVVEINKTYITKKFSNIENVKKEVEFLQILKDNKLNVPNIIDIKNDTLILEDLGEITLLDWYENLESLNSNDYKDIMMKLARWMKDFYNLTNSCFNKQFILSDVNFRNFIIKDNEVYGIDFEQAELGNIENNAGKLVSFALTYKPAMTNWKINFCDEFINVLSLELKIDKELIIKEKEIELKKLYNRRKI